MTSKRELDALGEEVKAKRKKRAGNQHKWNDDEVNAILDYMKGTILKNEEIEKPTVAAYYEKMSKSINIADVNGVKMKAKVSNLKSSYARAVNWRGKTGQGVAEENGLEAVKSYILKICPQFDDLDEIFSSKASMNPPFVHDSGTMEEQEVNYMDVPEDRLLVLPEPITPESPMSSCSTSTSSSSRVETMKEKLQGRGTLPKKDPKKDMLTLLTESHTQWAQVQSKKVDVEEKRLVQEAAWKEKGFLLQEKRLDSDNELKRMELEKDERMEKYRIDQEFKLKLELAKLSQEPK